MPRKSSRSASAAFTLIELMIVIAIIAIVAAIAIPNLVQARKHGNETAAIGALKTITSSEAIYRDRDFSTSGSYASLVELSSGQLIDSVLGSGTKQGYVFDAQRSQTSPEYLWFGTANPAVPQTTGDRYFEVNLSGVIFYTTVGSATMNITDCAIAPTSIPVGK